MATKICDLLLSKLESLNKIDVKQKIYQIKAYS